MKKYLLLFAAVIAMIATSFTLTSCGSDDDDDYTDTFTIYAKATQGNLSTEEYQALSTGLAKMSNTRTGTKSEAVVAFKTLVTTYDSYMQEILSEFKGDNVTITLYFTNSKGTIIDQHTWYSDK